MANFDTPKKHFPVSWTFRLFFGGYWDLTETIGDGMDWLPIFSQMVTIYGDNALTTWPNIINILEGNNFMLLYEWYA